MDVLEDGNEIGSNRMWTTSVIVVVVVAFVARTMMMMFVVVLERVVIGSDDASTTLNWSTVEMDDVGRRSVRVACSFRSFDYSNAKLKPILETHSLD